MKKIKKSFALLLSLMMLLSVVSVPAMAGEVPASTIQPMADAWMGTSSGVDTYPAGNYIRIAGRGANMQMYWPRAAIGAFAYDVSEIFETLSNNEGYVVDSVKLKPTKKSSANVGSNLKLLFYPITTKWDDAANDNGYTVFNGDTKFAITNTETVTGNYCNFKNDLALTLESDSDLAAEYDITSLFKLHESTYKGTDLQNFFSFAVTMTCDTTASYAEVELYSNEYGDGAEIVVTYSKPEPMAVDGEPVLPSNPDDDFEISFNNPISEASVKIGDTILTDGVTIDGKRLVVDYPFEQFKAYIIEVYAKDDYDTSVKKTYIFATGKDPSAPIAGLTNPTAVLTSSELTSLSFEAISGFDKSAIEAALTLQDADGNTIDGASFEYEATSDGGVVTLASPVALEANTSYKVVVAVGTVDETGAVITADNSVIYEFTTNPNDDSPSANPNANMLKVDYNSDSAAATIYYISKYYRNHSVTVSVVDTADNSTIYTADLATDSDGVLMLDNVSVTPDGNYIVYVAPLYGKKSHADVVNEAYTSFLWTLATQSTDASAIEERFGIICSTFGLTVGYSDKIDDIDDFYDKLASLRTDYPIGGQNAENEAKLKTVFGEIGLFVATEDVNDLTAPSDARELYDAMLAKIADRDFATKLAEVESQCSSDGSSFFADVYDGFIAASKTINSYADFEELLKSSYNTEKSAVLLGKFATMTHLSQVGALLTDAETIDAFGIQSLVDRYNALNSTSEVDNALYGKTFADNSAFISTLSSALTSAERVDPPAPQKPKPSPSKGGSAIVGAIGAPVDTTPVVNNEKLLYTDLAGYDWAKEYIDALSADGIINGKGNGEFDPAGKVLREEAVKMIVEAFDITASGDAAFDDVSSADWFRGFVLTAKNAGIVNGISASSFGAGMSITRQDAAVMLFTALSKKGLASAIAGSDSSFADDADIAAYARDAVAYMNSVGAITGYADGTFKPMSTITRAEFAVVLGRIYNTLK